MECADFAFRMQEHESVLSHDGQGGSMPLDVADMDKCDKERSDSVGLCVLERATLELSHMSRK